MKYHDVANIFPMMSDDEFKDLVADIKQNGLLEPIWTYQNQIIDGRNRYAACIEAGIAPRFREWNGQGSLVAFVVSLNLKRRHLSSGQKATVAVDMLPLLEQEAKERQLATLKQNNSAGDNPLVKNLTDGKHDENAGKAAEQAAQLTGTNRQYVSDAKKLKETAPDLFDDVRTGDKTIAEAKKEMRQRDQKTQEQQAQQAAPKENTFTVTTDQAVIPCVAVITDPPYGILDEEWEPAELETFTKEWLSRWNACGADFIVSFWSQDYLFDGRVWFDSALTNYEFQQLLIWHYPNNKKPQSRMGFKQTWEPIYFYRRKECIKQVKISNSDWGDGLNDFDCHIAAVPQSNFNDADMKQHPAQKPVSVMAWLINALTVAGDLIVDPFCGSGTTGIAAVKLVRRFHGIEINDAYCNLAKGRINLYGFQ